MDKEKVVLKPVDGVLTLCGGKNCCPTVRKIGDTFVITDDNGQSVTLTDEQMNLLRNADLSFNA